MFQPKITLKTLAALAAGVLLFACNKENGKKGDDPTPAPTPAGPSLTVAPEALNFAFNASDPQTLTVTANVAWESDYEAAWLAPTPTEGSGNATVSVEVAPNTTLQSRTATITFKSGELTATVTVTQAPDEDAVAAAKLLRQKDSTALMAIYTASNGATWKEGRVWDLTQPMDKWYGVTVDTTDTDLGRVVELKLSASTVPTTTAEWTIPAAIGDLTELTMFQIEKSRVTGALPDELYTLTKLKKLYLNNNNITGSFSTALGNLTELEELRILASANFTGTIPTTIGNLKKLRSISLSQTKIKGSIPTELAGCTSLQQFMAFQCQLSGELPEIWDQFKNNFSILMLYDNSDLYGPLPTSLGNITTGATSLSIQLYNCNFEGGIPASFANLPAVCKQLFLDGNCLEGQIPAAVVAHANYQTWKTGNSKHLLFNQQEGYVLYE